MTIIGITGPTGAGKTTALNELEKLGGVIIDCDAVYHELLKSDLTLQGELQSRFGVLTDENGVFDRIKRLRHQGIFSKVSAILLGKELEILNNS